MRDEISNAEVDRILQQLRQDQPAAAADDPVDSILKSLGVEPSAGQGKRRLHQYTSKMAFRRHERERRASRRNGGKHDNPRDRIPCRRGQLNG